MIDIQAINERTIGEHDIHVHAFVKKRKERLCPHCQSTKIEVYMDVIRFILDTPIDGKRRFILLMAKRYKCARCFKTFDERCDDLYPGHGMTRRMAEWIDRQRVNGMSMYRMAKETGMDEGFFRSYFKRKAAQNEKQANEG